MIKKMGRYIEKKYYIIYSIITFVLLEIIFLFICFILLDNNTKLDRNNLTKELVKDIEQIELNISEKMEFVFKDLMYLKGNVYLNKYILDEKDNKLKDLEKALFIFSDLKPIYTKVRYLDLDGNEIICIERNDNNVEILEKKYLEKKGGSKFYKESLKLKRNQIYVGEIDLNVENGEIERPFKPIIRFVLPIYDEVNKVGYIILNYNANYLLNYIDLFIDKSKISFDLVNLQGYYLISESHKTWGFLFDELKNERVQNINPELWEKISLNKSGISTIDDKVFVFDKIKPYERIFHLKNDWYILLKAKRAYMFEKQEKSIRLFYLMIIYSTTFCMIIALFLEYILERNYRNNIVLKKMAEYDSLTGIYNRQMAIVFLEQFIKIAERKKEHLSIVYIDVNWLKNVNDIYGHEEGDRFLINITKEISALIRKSDIFSRLGGDEFLLILPNIKNKEAELLMNRIDKRFNEINVNGEYDYLYSISYGIVEYSIGKLLSANEMLAKADKKMYDYKIEFKKKYIKKDNITT